MPRPARIRALALMLCLSTAHCVAHTPLPPAAVSPTHAFSQAYAAPQAQVDPDVAPVRAGQMNEFRGMGVAMVGVLFFVVGLAIVVF